MFADLIWAELRLIINLLIEITEQHQLGRGQSEKMLKQENCLKSLTKTNFHAI